jgi:hypothetical protein
MIFVGEHTSYTHAWIASAIESGVRGSVQLLLGKITSFYTYQILPNVANSVECRTWPD